MRSKGLWGGLLLVATVAMALVLAAAGPDTEELLARHRNLGKAFYENPATQQEAVDELKGALDLAPESARERLNYGLALLRNGQVEEGIAELERVQREVPSIPHTWFNLGIEYKRRGEFSIAAQQFEQMLELVPDHAISRYNLGAVYRQEGRIEDAIRELETARDLEPTLAAPHFQLFNLYRKAGRTEEAAEELKVFEALKQQQEGAVIPEDIEWSLYSELLDEVEPALDRETQPSAELAFMSRELEGEVDTSSSGLAVFDLEADSRSDLIAWSSNGIRIYRGGTERVEDEVLGDIRDVLSVAPGDFDNDGRADLAVTTAEGAVLLSNQSTGFTRHSAPLPTGRFTQAVWLDYDHDNDVDLLLFGSGGALLRNQGSAGFTDRTSDFPFADGEALAVAAFRLIPDTKTMDLAVSYAGQTGVLYRDKLGGSYEATPLAGLPSGATQLRAADLNCDGWFDLAFAGADSVSVLYQDDGAFTPIRVGAGEGVALADLENRGRLEVVSTPGVFRSLPGQGFSQASRPAGFVDASEWAAADFNGDGLLDLAAAGGDGRVHLLINETQTENQWVRIALDGQKAPKLAPGAEIEVKAGTRYQKALYPGYPLHFGLRHDEVIDAIRITWSNGLMQSEIKQSAGQLHRYQEAERLSGSCPMIWTWDGNRFRFITDVLGVAPLGATAGDGEYFPTDHDEYIQIPAGALRPREGRYEIRITEELSEVAYLDQVKLIAVDHPAETDIFTNEKFQGPPFPEFRLFETGERHYPVSARGGDGGDVLSKLVAKDRRYPDDFERSRLGVAARHSLELDFGGAAPENNAVMVLSGWVDWADGSTFLARSQEADGGLVMPYLQVLDETGEWVTVIEDMGIPAGKPKTIVVDLEGKFIGPERRVRIVTNLCVFWDEIFLAEDAPEPRVELTEVAGASAKLAFRGFSEPVIHPERRQPETFLYHSRHDTSMWNQTPGLYTRYGDVEGLLADVDDRFVVMGSGDEVTLLFDAASMPRPRQGWKRDFLLKVDGWAKDRDPNTAYSQTVEPLPFHGMSAYPYGADESYPRDAVHQTYLREYNTRPALRPLQPLHTRGENGTIPLLAGRGIPDPDM